MRPIFLMACLLLLLFVPGLATATVHNGTINGDEAQATTCAAGSTSEILGTVTYDDVSGLFSWNYTYGDNAPSFNNGNLFGAGSETISHFHGPALPGVGGGVQVGAGTGTPNVGSATISGAQGTDLLNELWYLNVHSSTCTGGELRGQVLFPPAPALAPTGSAMMTTLLVAGLLAASLLALRPVVVRARD